MAFVIPALAVVGTALGASAGTAAAVGATAISTAISIAGTAVAGYASHQQAKSQAAIARQAADIAGENANRARFRSQVEQQDQDLLAKAVLGELASSQAASGLSFTSGTFGLQRRSAQVLARRDALNIRQGGELEAYNFLQEQSDLNFESRQARTAGRLSLIETAFGIGDSLISGATQVNRIRAAELSRTGYRTRAGLIE